MRVDPALPARMSEEAYLRLPETTQRMDFLDGEVILPPAPSLDHQDLVKRLCLALEAWCQAQPVPRPYLVLAPADVRFAPGRILQPDLAVFLAGRPARQRGPITVIPDLCVEVLSPGTEDYDRHAKRLVYGAAGVRELWIVDPLTRTAVRWSGKGLQESDEPDEALTSLVLPGLVLPLAPFFDALSEC